MFQSNSFYLLIVIYSDTETAWGNHGQDIPVNVLQSSHRIVRVQSMNMKFVHGTVLNEPTLSSLSVLLSQSFACLLSITSSAYCCLSWAFYWAKLRIWADRPLCQFFSLANRGPLAADSNISLWHEEWYKGKDRKRKTRGERGNRWVRDDDLHSNITVQYQRVQIHYTSCNV